MKRTVNDSTDSETTAGPRLRCFLSAPLVISLVLGSSGAVTASAATCPALPDMSLSRLQGTIYGPSGVPVPQILVRAMQGGKQVAETHTDDKGRFQLKVAPGNYVVHVQFLGAKSIDMNVRIGHTAGDLFHTARLRTVLGLSGARCSFVTTSSRQFKSEMKRYEQRLVELPPGP